MKSKFIAATFALFSSCNAMTPFSRTDHKAAAQTIRKDGMARSTKKLLGRGKTCFHLLTDVISQATEVMEAPGQRKAVAQKAGQTKKFVAAAQSKKPVPRLLKSKCERHLTNEAKARQLFTTFKKFKDDPKLISAIQGGLDQKNAAECRLYAKLDRLAKAFTTPSFLSAWAIVRKRFAKRMSSKLRDLTLTDKIHMPVRQAMELVSVLNDKFKQHPRSGMILSDAIIAQVADELQDKYFAWWDVHVEARRDFVAGIKMKLQEYHQKQLFEIQFGGNTFDFRTKACSSKLIKQNIQDFQTLAKKTLESNVGDDNANNQCTLVIQSKTAWKNFPWDKINHAIDQPGKTNRDHMNSVQFEQWILCSYSNLTKTLARIDELLQLNKNATQDKENHVPHKKHHAKPDKDNVRNLQALKDQLTALCTKLKNRKTRNNVLTRIREDYQLEREFCILMETDQRKSLHQNISAIATSSKKNREDLFCVSKR